jgi:hypothetical protein
MALSQAKAPLTVSAVGVRDAGGRSTMPLPDSSLGR